MAISALTKHFRGPTTSIDDQIESFATERVPGNLRWPIPAISLVLLGNATAMFFFSFGAQQTFLVGWPWLLIPIGYFFVGAVLVGMLTMRVAAGEGLSQNLLSRGLGFGSRGAAVTSFIYAVNYIYYFLFEGTIVSHAIAIYFDIPINSFRGIIDLRVSRVVHHWRSSGAACRRCRSCSPGDSRSSSFCWRGA